ncbi:hypothetical protein BDV28DRAFT_127020 [Aspergillus coremiiformis]|uniref:Protein kinase domain-containing protein n=1 Tax=Aspergillus coremiiformis TaxID=138285 RepID=A0A5N6ZGE4_9EURO|nr:hypothetical protein BDV28DRAFT_127020 [Aspergillus coremiiformis]
MRWHMLLLDWGGEDLRHIKTNTTVRDARYSLGVVHDGLRPENGLWDVELQRALIIEFLPMYCTYVEKSTLAPAIPPSPSQEICM